MRKSGKPKNRVHIAWNEENLEYLEATKSPKQKINEPKTPYRPPEESDGDVSPIPDENRTSLDAVAHAEAVRHALSDVASTSNGQNSHSRGGWTSSEDEAEDMCHSTETGVGNSFSSFEEHRRKHYDEYRKVKLLQSQGSQLGDDDDDYQEDDRRKKFAVCPRQTQDQECCLAGGVCAMELHEGTPSSEEM